MRSPQAAVDAAIHARKLAPAQREWAEKYATKDPAGFADYVDKTPELFSDPIGSDADAPPARGRCLGTTVTVTDRGYVPSCLCGWHGTARPNVGTAAEAARRHRTRSARNGVPEAPGTDDLVDALHELGRAARDLESDRETRAMLKRLGLDDLTGLRPSEERDALLRFARKLAKEEKLPEYARQLQEVARRANELSGKSGPRERTITPAQVRRAYEAVVRRGVRRQRVERTAESLGVSARTVERVWKDAGEKWPPAPKAP